MRDRTVTVVGGGLSGLASAVGLARAGWRVRVLERRPEGGEVGSGLALPRNGVTALGALGIGEERVDEAGHRTVGTGFVDTLGRRVLTIPADDPRVRRAVTVWGFHRQRLHALLSRAARDTGVERVDGARVTHVERGRPEGPPAVVHWRRDTVDHRDESDLVVGADGMWSAVRTALHPEVRPRYSGSTSWRALIPVGALEGTGMDGRLVEYWGPGAEFGVMRVSADLVYWYGYERQPEGSVFDDELATARAHFAGWAPGVVSLIESTAPDQLMRHDVHHLVRGPRRYHRGRVVLVGDAAHGALPTMGQGAATALEDGAVLARLAEPAREGDLGRALAEFDALRRPRCRAIARQARLVARVGADLGGGWRQRVRNAAFRLIPANALVPVGMSAVSWSPPEPLTPA
ncbi:FAD-dependent monooxygenase [Nocardiopsis sp. NPDC007018]|uniref:FAD-dependent monooxygenase n=1 Tax=Nocardiopsis sp. NPDC007018 TaxID=3155721 RepID=UPI003410ED34